MAHTRVIYQNEAVYVGPTPSTSGHYKYVSGSAYTSNGIPTQKLNQLDPLVTLNVLSGNTTGLVTLNEMKSGLRPNLANLDRIQSVDYGFNISRKDVNQYGVLAAIDRVIVEQPSINVNFTYLQNGMKNEDEMGFDVRAIKRSAYVSFSTNAVTGLNAITILDGGQSYTNSFTQTLLGTNNAVINFIVATGGVYAGQVTGITTGSPGVGITSSINGASALLNNVYSSVNTNTGFGGAYTPSINSVYPEGTANQISISCISGILNKVSDDNNIFIRTVAQGNDVTVATTGTLDQQIICFGNTIITSYQAQGQVGDFPKVTINNDALNFSVLTGGNNYTDPNYRYALPSIDTLGGKINGSFSLPDYNGRTDLNNYISVFKPGSIVLDLTAYGNIVNSPTGMGVDVTNTFYPQSYTLSFDLKRESLRKLGSTYYYAKEIQFPVNYNLSVSLIVGDVVNGNLAAMISGDPSFDASISFIKPGTEFSNYGRITGSKYTVRGLKLSSQEYSSSVGSNKTVTLKFDGQLGSAQDLTKGINFNSDYYLFAPEII